MSDDRLLDAERAREIAECKHTTGYDLVCRGCGLPAAAPLEGYDIFNGEWDDPAYD